MNTRPKVRAHVSFPTRHLDEARQFYERLFGVAPAKVKPDYVKFSVERPALNFSLTRTVHEIKLTASHYGIELGGSEQVRAWQQRLHSAGVIAEAPQQQSCCYAEQTKFWVEDPDGRPWEIFYVHGDTEEFGERTRDSAAAPSGAKAKEQSCCAPDCCT